MTLNKILELLKNQTELEYLVYTLIVDEKTKLLNISIGTINREWKRKKVKIDNALYSKIVEVLKQLRGYEKYMKPRLLEQNNTAWGKRR